MTALDTRTTCPAWCALARHEPIQDRHVSKVLRVGNRYAGKGELGVFLEQHTGGPTYLALSIAHMGVAHLQLDLDQGVQARDALTELLDLAGTDA
uniref:hypothetical protein n=1 Tax=Paractinoplanes polyasparticus TaxID=2856853 RepID=UPI001C84BC2F|nr:hypothetical protein [Actinoplanes polyasparticus]